MATPVISSFIAGQHVPRADLPRLDKHDPSTGQLIARVEQADSHLIDMAVDAAAKAARGPWRTLSADARATWLRRIAEAVGERADAFVDAEVRDTGKPATMVRTVEIPRVIATFETFAELIRNANDDVTVTPLADHQKTINLVTRMPHGVVGIICPWNFPLVLAVWKIAPALACGNTIVIKPSEESPSSLDLLTRVIADLELPKGVFNVVYGLGRDGAGAMLAEHTGVNALTFTGETRTGEAIMKAAANGVRPVSLELGGKNAAVVFASADIDAAVAGTSRSAFLNSGQVCFGTERVYVQRPAYEAFVEKLVACANALKLGDPLDPTTTMGPLISWRHRDKVLAACEQARSDGAAVRCGGAVPDMESRLARGAWMAPTVWTGLTESAHTVRHEVFGPCCHVAPFDTEDEALVLANDSEYGLAAALWTRDHAQAFRVSTQLNVGVVWVNTWGVRDLRTPFGGIGRSGLGREGGRTSLDFYSQQRTICSIV